MTRQPPPDERQRAKMALVERFRTAYKALDQASGWVEQIDYTMLGFDSRDHLRAAIEKAKADMEAAIDAVHGDDWQAKATLAYRQAWPFVARLIDLVRAFMRL